MKVYYESGVLWIWWWIWWVKTYRVF